MIILAVLALVTVLIGAGLLLGGSDERKRIAGAPVAHCAQIPAGHEVKLSGRAVADEALTGPLSNQPCVFYRMIFLQQQQDNLGRDRGLYEAFRMHKAAEGFAIADATGKVELDTEAVDLRVKKAHSGTGGILGMNQIDAVVAEHLNSGQRTTVNELIIPVGAPLIAIGEAMVVKGRAHFGGKRLLLSVLPEAELLKRDRGDFAGFALIVLGVLGLGAAIYDLIR